LTVPGAISPNCQQADSWSVSCLTLYPGLRTVHEADNEHSRSEVDERGSMATVQIDRITREFIDLVRIDSPAGEEAALAVDLAGRLTALGLQVSNDHSGPSTGNLIARWEASGPGEPILLTAHLDTVDPGRSIKPVLQDGVIRSDGTTI